MRKYPLARATLPKVKKKKTTTSRQLQLPLQSNERHGLRAISSYGFIVHTPQTERERERERKEVRVTSRIASRGLNNKIGTFLNS